MFTKFGALEKPWTIFSSNELIKNFKTKYDFKGVPYVFIKKKSKILYQQYAFRIDEIKKHLKQLQAS